MLYLRSIRLPDIDLRGSRIMRSEVNSRRAKGKRAEKGYSKGSETVICYRSVTLQICNMLHAVFVTGHGVTVSLIWT